MNRKAYEVSSGKRKAGAMSKVHFQVRVTDRSESQDPRIGRGSARRRGGREAFFFFTQTRSPRWIICNIIVVLYVFLSRIGHTSCARHTGNISSNHERKEHRGQSILGDTAFSLYTFFLKNFTFPRESRYTLHDYSRTDLFTYFRAFRLYKCPSGDPESTQVQWSSPNSGPTNSFQSSLDQSSPVDPN